MKELPKALIVCALIAGAVALVIVGKDNAASTCSLIAFLAVFLL